MVANKLIAFACLHRLNVLQLRAVVFFFWLGQHWVQSDILYLPQGTQKWDIERGQGLVDIRSRIMTFHLQATLSLLYNRSISREHTETSLLRRAGGMGLDEQLFLERLVELRYFNWSVFEAWKEFLSSRIYLTL